MPRYAALLRAVNVGGRQVRMAPLRAALAAKGYDNVQTLLASGNVIFDSRARSSAKLEPQLDADILACTGVAAEAVVRNAGEMSAIIAANPFPKQAKDDPTSLVCVLCRGKPDAASIAAYMKTYDGPEQVKVHGRELYITYPDGQARSGLKLPRKAFLGTARNWNTMLKLDAALSA